MKFHRTALLLGLALFAGAAAAQTSVNTARCTSLSNDVQTKFQAAVTARTPTQDPSSFNQDSFDVKGILTQDPGAAFSKLMNLDFSSIISSLVTKVEGAAEKRAASAFNSKVNGILASVKVPAINMSGVTNNSTLGSVISQANSGISQLNSNTAATLNTAVSNTVNNVVAPPTTTPKSTPVGPYGK